MSATVVDICDGVVAAINAGTFSPAFTAARSFLAVYDIGETADLVVNVVPRSGPSNPPDTVEVRGSRAGRFVDFAVDVGVQKKVAAGDDEAIAELIALVEAIGDFLANRALAGVAVRWIRNDIPQVYLEEHLRNLHQFSSVITVTYRGLKN